MASVNKVIIVGNLGKDPETKSFENGGSIVSFPVATTESYWDKEKNQRVEQPTDWHNIRVSRPGLTTLASQYLKKGSQVFVEGVIRYRQYQTKEGETRYITEIQADTLHLLDGKQNSEGNAAAAPVDHNSDLNAVHQGQPASDDLPF
jgi:single-strand DNA-binding protein